MVERSTVRREAEVLLDDAAAVVAQAVSDEVDHPEVRDGDVGRRSLRCFERTKRVVLDRVGPGVKHQGQGTASASGNRASNGEKEVWLQFTTYKATTSKGGRSYSALSLKLSQRSGLDGG
jgi:hypothetical protein